MGGLALAVHRRTGWCRRYHCRAIFFAVVLALIAPAALAVAIPSTYDSQIRAASERWLPGWDWRWLKAQYYQESLLQPDVCSHAGACGIAQFMPGTWREVHAQMRLPAGITPFHADHAIEAGAYYMRRQRGIWTSQRPESDRRELAQASYNAGAGNILRAQRVCVADGAEGCLHWPAISAHLHRVTGRHSHETITYVQRIRRWYLLLS